MRRPALLVALTAAVLAAVPVSHPAHAGPDPRIVDPAFQDAPRTSDGGGNFRIQCGVSHHVADDPIVRPDQPGGSHLHSFAGNTAVDAYTTAESLRSTGESTCHGGTLNRSGYWIPTLHDVDGRILRQDPWHVYYKNGAVDPTTIRPMPPGLRMVAGDARATSAQPLSVIRLSCGTTPIRRAEDFSSTMPTCAQGDFVALSIMFPQCWNGRDLDAPDHKAHMAYAEHTGQPWHTCPATHPVPLPAITINLHQVVREARGSGGWRLSSDAAGSPGGISLHADWFDGWDSGVVSTFVRHCINERRDCAGGTLGNGTGLSWFTDGAGELRVTQPRVAASPPPVATPPARPRCRPVASPRLRSRQVTQRCTGISR